jgi:hypothetical protein
VQEKPEKVTVARKSAKYERNATGGRSARKSAIGRVIFHDLIGFSVADNV